MAVPRRTLGRENFGQNFQRNLDLVQQVREIAREKGCTPAQLAPAWLLAQGQDIVPIPDTKRRKYLEENLGALDVHRTFQDLESIDDMVPLGVAAGQRYPADSMAALNR